MLNLGGSQSTILERAWLLLQHSRHQNSPTIKGLTQQMFLCHIHVDFENMPLTTVRLRSNGLRLP
jgi:hypothetical protein